MKMLHVQFASVLSSAKNYSPTATKLELPKFDALITYLQEKSLETASSILYENGKVYLSADHPVSETRGILLDSLIQKEPDVEVASTQPLTQASIRQRITQSMGVKAPKTKPHLKRVTARSIIAAVRSGLQMHTLGISDAKALDILCKYASKKA